MARTRSARDAHHERREPRAPRREIGPGVHLQGQGARWERPAKSPAARLLPFVRNRTHDWSQELPAPHDTHVPRGRAPAKMEFRAPLALIRLTASSAIF